MAWPSCWRSAPLPLWHPTLLFLSTSSKPPRPDMPLRAVHSCHLHSISGPDLISLSDRKPLWLLLGQPLAHTSSPASAAGVILSNTNLIMSLHYFKLFPECWQYTHAHTQHTHIHKHSHAKNTHKHTHKHPYIHTLTNTHTQVHTNTHIQKDTHLFDPWKESPESLTGPTMDCTILPEAPQPHFSPLFPVLGGSHLCKIK